MPSNYWLMKAEPDSRVIKGKDVKFSVDDFEHVGTTPWEGVRNHEAKNLMKMMKVDDLVLFYHSNCKNPGIAGFAQVSKEAYPDYTAWDPTHPYYDAKSDAGAPKWFMVDLTFRARAAHFVPLALLRRLAALPSSTPPPELKYLGAAGVAAVKGMALVTRGRLSVQRVEQGAWDALGLLAEHGGWEDAPAAAKVPRKKAPPKTLASRRTKGVTGGTLAGGKPDAGADGDAGGEGAEGGDGAEDVAEEGPKARAVGRKRKASQPPAEDPETDSGQPPLRRSTRRK